MLVVRLRACPKQAGVVEDGLDCAPRLLRQVLSGLLLRLFHQCLLGVVHLTELSDVDFLKLAPGWNRHS